MALPKNTVRTLSPYDPENPFRVREIILNDRQRARFWSYVDQSGGPDACWPWTRNCDSGGYGKFWGGWGMMAHRVAYTLLKGQIPRGLVVLHDCPDGDNPICCNPAHLRAGTQGENNADRAAKGRNGPRNHRGEANPMAIFSEGDVLEIRHRWRCGESQHCIAETFDTSQAVISNIVHRKRWKHL